MRLMAEKPKNTENASIRAGLKKKLGDNIGEAMGESLLSALASTKTEWFECHACHKKTPLVMPNAFERAKACQTILEQLEGKVGTHREVPAAAKKNVGELSDMSDDDLLAIIQGDSDGETDGGAEEETSE